MNISSPWILFVHGFAVGFISTWSGLILVNIRANKKNLILVGICYAFLNVYLRSMPLIAGAHFIILTCLLIFIIMLVWNMQFVQALAVSVLGSLVLLISESICFPLMLHIWHLDFSTFKSNIYFSWINPLPPILLIIVFILICNKYKIHIVDFKKLARTKYPTLNGKRIKIVLSLIIIMFFLLMVQVMCNMIIFCNNSSYLIKNISLEQLVIITNITLVAAVLVVIFLIRQLLELSEKERRFDLQEAYIETFDELHTAVSAQKHDRINHIQTLYGFIQLGQIKEAQEYLEELMGDVVMSDKFIITGNPGLSALFYIKSGIAMTNGIQLDVSVNNSISDIAVPAYELNRIVGNLINNSFDCVSLLDKPFRKVRVLIDKDETNNIFEIYNYGYINDQIRARIFEKGFSTKKGSHSGLGLYIVKQLVTNYHGNITAENIGDMIMFRVTIPKSTADKTIITAQADIQLEHNL